MPKNSSINCHLLRPESFCDFLWKTHKNSKSFISSLITIIIQSSSRIIIVWFCYKIWWSFLKVCSFLPSMPLSYVAMTMHPWPDTSVSQWFCQCVWWRELSIVHWSVCLMYPCSTSLYFCWSSLKSGGRRVNPTWSVHFLKKATIAPLVTVLFWLT